MYFLNTLTQWGMVTHICSNMHNAVIVDLGDKFLGVDFFQLIINQLIRNKSQWNLNQDTKIPFLVNTLKSCL